MDNKERMKQFLVEKYRASTAMELFVEKDASPGALYRRAVVPVH